MWYSSPPRIEASGLTTLKMTFREMVPVLVDTFRKKVEIYGKVFFEKNSICLPDNRIHPRLFAVRI